MNKFKIFLAAVAAVAMATPAMAATFEFHGDLNNRFGLYTNQAGMYHGVESVTHTWKTEDSAIKEDDDEEFFADIKYRLQTTAATNDGAVKGVFAIEIGGIQFGTSGGGGFSGDGVNIETRLAYTDFQIPNTQSRVSIGLQAFTVNQFLWWETATGVQLKGSNYALGWARGIEVFNTDDDDDEFLEDLDNFYARVDLTPAEGAKLGLFALYQRMDDLADVDPDNPLVGNSSAGDVAYQVKRFAGSEFDLYTLGVDGGFTTPTSYGNAFVNWDLMYQGGEIANNITKDEDVSAWFAHADVGVNVGATRFTYTGWYSSGDDDDTDGDRENFMTTDNDRADSIIFFEGGFTDDDYFTETQYILDKGLIFNKLAVDHRLTEKTTIGGAVLYLMTAEDLELADGSKEDKLGTEIDAYVSYKLYDNLELAFNAGYLFADDGMDYWEDEADGSSDADIFRTTARVRYTF